MKLDITGRHIDVTTALKEAVDKKFDRLVRHFDHLTDVHVILSVEKLRHSAEATIHVSGNTIFADATEENMYAAIDSLVDKLDRQIKRHKEKQSDHHSSEGRKSNLYSE